jgi:hypothetical protein
MHSMREIQNGGIHMMTKEQVYRAALELIQADRNEHNQPARDRADLISVAVLAIRHADRRPVEPGDEPGELQRVRENYLKLAASFPPLCCAGSVTHQPHCPVLAEAKRRVAANRGVPHESK